MRQDWDERARADARHYIYTRDSTSEEADFDASGRANYDQLVRPYLPVLLDGRPPSACRALEIGCGIGRMTRWLAAEFGEVDGVDVSPVMIEQARARLCECPNVRLHAGSGHDLHGLPDSHFDFAFSYIVFQHVPSREVIAEYIRETARVLRPRGVFKFQLNGAPSPRGREPDTWQGVTFEEREAAGLLAETGFSMLAAEGIGTQYFVLTARKGGDQPEVGPRTYIFPGEPWAAAQLGEGWGEAVDGSWRPVAARFETRLAAPRHPDARFFLGLYIWPEEPAHTHRLQVQGIGAAELRGPGDHYIELAASACPEPLRITIDPPPKRPPALRALGYFVPRQSPPVTAG